MEGFGFAEIEDFWIKYFCNSANITNSTMDIHEKDMRGGSSVRQCRLQVFYPIAFNGCMLLDGGYLDNLPVNEMKKRCQAYYCCRCWFC